MKSKNRTFLLAGKQMGRILGFLRVSTDMQELNNQKLEILEWGRRHDVKIDDFVQYTLSTRKKKLAFILSNLLEMVDKGDTVVVVELSRLSRTLGQLVGIVKSLSDKGVRLVSLKEGLDIDATNKDDLQTTMMVGIFSLLYDIERRLISARTKAGIENARSQGKQIGRPKGSTGKSKLDPYKDQIQALHAAQVSYSAMGRMFGCHRETVKAFIEKKN